VKLISLEISNILSIETASLSFEDNGLVLIEGWNYDTGRANGAGKTAIANSISFGLYDKLPRKITASEIVRRGCKEGFVRCSVLCGEEIWTVHRSRPKGVQFFRDGVAQNITQSEFESKLRLTYEQFLLTIYVPQTNSGSFGRFLSCSDSDKKKFLLQLLDLGHFNDCKGIADNKIKNICSQIDQEQSKIDTAISKIEAYKESLVDADDVTSTIKSLNKDITTLQKEVLNLSDVQKPDLSKYSKLEEDIKSKINEIAQAKAKRSMLHDKYRELSASIHEYSSDACSECGSILDTPERRAAHEQLQSKITEKLKLTKTEIDNTDAVIDKENAINDLQRKLRDKKNQESSSYQDAYVQLSELKSNIKNKQSQIDSLNLKLKSNAELHTKITNLNSSIAAHTTNHNNAVKELDLYKAISVACSPTGAQAYVLDSVVDSFNERIQKYLDLISPNMSYILNSYKENSKGDVVAKFSETLTKGGKEVSIGSLSGGEQKGLSICVDFALLEVLETQFGMSLNPIVLDEPFDGLDTTGKEIVIELLEQLAKSRQIIVIDHASEAKALFSKVIRVELRNDISKIL
jgi:DNA repair exonuclease SbcCD ATPase subunit